MEESLFRELGRKISQYLDQEMSLDDKNAFLQEMDNDPYGQNVLQKEIAIRDKIRQKLVRPVLSDNFVQDIRNKINKYPGR